VPIARDILDVALQPNIGGYQYWFHTQLDFRALTKD
jgi:peptide/nickel transport system substrate-binding protein